jgi:hypothetical protein
MAVELTAGEVIERAFTLLNARNLAELSYSPGPSTDAYLEATATYAPAILAFELLVTSIKDVYEKVGTDLRNDNFASGFSQGLTMGLLGWKWRQAVDLFARRYVIQVYRRQDLNQIRVTYYNLGLSVGYHHVAALSTPARRAYLTAAKKDSKARAGQWTRDDQVSYVIALATAIRRRFMNF